MTAPTCLVAISQQERARRRKKIEDFILDNLASTVSMDLQDNFRDLMQRVREGSEDAAWELVDKYGGYLRRAVRRVLSHKLRSKFDSLDFVQLVWNSFFRERGEIDHFERPEHFVKFLAGMADNKVKMEARRRLSLAQYNVGREVSLGHAPGEDGCEIAAHEPEPVDLAIARERREQLLSGQPERYRQIIQLKLQGHSPEEIATILELDGHTVRRFLTKLSAATVL